MIGRRTPSEGERRAAIERAVRSLELSGRRLVGDVGKTACRPSTSVALRASRTILSRAPRTEGRGRREPLREGERALEAAHEGLAAAEGASPRRCAARSAYRFPPRLLRRLGARGRFVGVSRSRFILRERSRGGSDRQRGGPFARLMTEREPGAGLVSRRSLPAGTSTRAVFWASDTGPFTAFNLAREEATAARRRSHRRSVPSVERASRSRAAPVAMLHEEGCAWRSDGLSAPRTTILSLFAEMAAFRKLPRRPPRGYDRPRRHARRRRGARMESEFGSIEPGKRAVLVALTPCVVRLATPATPALRGRPRVRVSANVRAGRIATLFPDCPGA